MPHREDADEVERLLAHAERDLDDNTRRRANQPPRSTILTITELLDIETRFAGQPQFTKLNHIAEDLRINPARYFQQLNTKVLDNPEALQLNPQLVNRLRNQREAARRKRVTRKH